MHDVLRAVSDAAGALEELAVDVDCAKLARQLRHSARVTVGLLPTDERVRIQPLALELAFAISLLTEKLTLVLDPEQESFATTAAGAGEPAGGTLLNVFVPANRVAIIAPALKAPAGAKFEIVRIMHQLAMRDPDSFGHVLVDLSGCRFPGELLGARKLLDGVIVVGEGGRSTEREILSTVKLLPRELDLGVLLTD
jgi:hypothetical protein